LSRRKKKRRGDLASSGGQNGGTVFEELAKGRGEECATGECLDGQPKKCICQGGGVGKLSKESVTAKRSSMELPKKGDFSANQQLEKARGAAYLATKGESFGQGGELGGKRSNNQSQAGVFRNDQDLHVFGGGGEKKGSIKRPNGRRAGFRNTSDRYPEEGNSTAVKVL